MKFEKMTEDIRWGIHFYCVNGYRNMRFLRGIALEKKLLIFCMVILLKDLMNIML